MNIKITSKFLWIPVSEKASQVKLHLFIDKDKIQEIDINLGKAEPDFYAVIDVENWIGCNLTILCDEEEVSPGSFILKEEKPEYNYPYRPLLHFTPEVGWNNDPNGLVYAGGCYHLYYQWNPFGTKWANMHWGHAVSKDLFRWEHQPAALSPDQYGPVFSGCGMIDRFNTIGYGNNTLLFYYTAAGGSNTWSKEGQKKFTQRLAYSLDGGTTLIKSEQFCMENMKKENRDPKIFYHEPTNTYIMVLFLDGYEFAIFRSGDLINWSETQRLQFEGMWECPDLFELSIDNDKDKRKWVFWSADGYYVIGNFDGYTFKAESEVLKAYCTKLPYAAQTFSGIDGRTVSLAWLRMKNNRGNYCGLMSLPMELSLTEAENQIRLKFKVAEEGAVLTDKYRVLPEEGLELEGKPLCLQITWKACTDGEEQLQIGSTVLKFNFTANCISMDTQEPESEKVNINFENWERKKLLLIIDQEVMEFIGNDGTVYGALEVEENILGKTISAAKGGTGISMEWCEFNLTSNPPAYKA